MVNGWEIEKIHGLLEILPIGVVVLFQGRGWAKVEGFIIERIASLYTRM